MQKKFILYIAFVLLAFQAFAQKLPPKSDRLVTDSTGALSAAEQQQLENKLDSYNDSTTTQIAVVVLHNVQGDDINDFAQKLGRAWGIGQKGKNNGILVLVALDEHKVSIQTGYGAEGAVPDIVTHQIIENDIVPNFRQKSYYEGLDEATTDLMKYMKGEYKATPTTAQHHRDNDNSGGSGAVVFVIVIIVIILLRIFRGGGGGGRVYGGGGNPFMWFFLGSLLGGGGRGGGWGGGGGFGGGDSGGGGFGGFGGGDFGGGGSSGSW